MGLKRIMAMIEVTYPADDPRSLDELKVVTRVGVDDGVVAGGGQLASWAGTGAAVDPDAEPSLPGVVAEQPTGLDPE